MVEMGQYSKHKIMLLKHHMYDETYYKDLLGKHGGGIDCAQWLEQDQGISLI
jgi:hypothetical protein